MFTKRTHYPWKLGVKSDMNPREIPEFLVM